MREAKEAIAPHRPRHWVSQSRCVEVKVDSTSAAHSWRLHATKGDEEEFPQHRFPIEKTLIGRLCRSEAERFKFGGMVNRRGSFEQEEICEIPCQKHFSDDFLVPFYKSIETDKFALTDFRVPYMFPPPSRTGNLKRQITPHDGATNEYTHHLKDTE